MKFFLYQSGSGIKVLLFVVGLGIRWLYRKIPVSDDFNQEGSDQDKMDLIDTEGVPSLSIVSQDDGRKEGIHPVDKETGKAFQHLIVTDRYAPVASRGLKLQMNEAIPKRFFYRSKRKFFKNALLMHELIQRKYFV